MSGPKTCHYELRAAYRREQRRRQAEERKRREELAARVAVAKKRYSELEKRAARLAIAIADLRDRFPGERVKVAVPNFAAPLTDDPRTLEEFIDKLEGEFVQAETAIRNAGEQAQATNSVKQRPFSVILFDEIEKAHPRLLDKFLQILEDGRLTDGRGDTVYFSEAVIVFTSNLGVFVEDENGERFQNVQPGDPYEEVERKIRTAIEDHFKFQLSRPEILNRIGDNIVVFNFIGADSAKQILDGMIANVIARVKAEHKLDLTVSHSAMAKIESLCLNDLANGGRGIGNRLESVLVNPLSRSLFQSESRAERSRVSIEDVIETDRVFSVRLT